MMEQLRQRLKTWLNGPLPSQPIDLSALQDRMDFLEKRLNQLSAPFNGTSTESVAFDGHADQPLENIPDAHLGAQ